MATLLLTAVGSAIAGPLGGAFGAILGQRADQALFAPRGRVGARLADLSVQSSSYGSAIPRLYGRTRVAGTVIWATDLREERTRVSQGKGRPKATVYSYSASFAVLLSGRRIANVGRIWADGKLLRGAAGDFKIETGFRFHAGTPDQPADPLIASAEGLAAPAYRGRAYAVFEDMALESFGNRIPMLTFEVFADHGPVDAGGIIEDLAGPAVVAQGGLSFDGYVADGGSVAAAIDLLAGTSDGQWRDSGGDIRLSPPQLPPFTIAERDLGAGVERRMPAARLSSRAPAASLPTRVEIGFADPARDYLAGLQVMDLQTEGRVHRLDLPAVIGAALAVALARDRLFVLRRDALSLEISLPWRCLPIWAKDVLRIDGALWRVRSIRLEGMCLICALVPHQLLPSVIVAADGGRSVPQQDEPAGATVLALIDLPAIGDTAATTAQVVVAAAGTGKGWRSAALLQRNGPAGDWMEIGATQGRAIIGEVLEPPLPASPHLFDQKSVVTVRLLHDDMSLLSAGDDALLAGANMAMIGDELVQFGAAARLAPRVWRLSKLLRARKGGDAAGGTHVAGERFVLLERETLLPLDVPTGVGALSVLAKGVGDVSGVTASLSSPGRALLPLPPVHLKAVAGVDGGIDLDWIRQSREGWAWLDGVEVPLGEDSELYRVTITGAPSGTVIAFEVTTTQLRIEATQLAGLRAAGDAHLHIAVSQVGRFGVSAVAETVILV